MNGRRRDSKEPAGEGRRVSRRLAVYYAVAGATLAFLRIALIVWGNHNQGTFSQWNLYWVLYPEELLNLTDFRPTGVFKRTVLFVVGSYILVAPTLAAGWLLHRPGLRRQAVVDYLSCGTVLALARVVVLVLANDRPHWSIPWVLYPEALFMTRTGLSQLGWDDSSFVFATLLAVGSYVIVSPMLLLARWRKAAA
jgi:hypothetical protein